MKICCLKIFCPLRKIDIMLLFLMSLVFHQIFLHTLASKFLFVWIFQQLFWHQNWRKIVDAGTYEFIAISIHCFDKFFKNLICIGEYTLVGSNKETWYILIQKTLHVSANFFKYSAVYHFSCPNDTRNIGARYNPFVNQGEGQSLGGLYKHSSYCLNTWSNVKPTPLFRKFLLIQRHVLKEPKANDFPYEAEQPQTYFAWIYELPPLSRVVLRSKAIKHVIDITAIAFALSTEKQFRSLVCREQKYMYI